jgi:phage terminase small subunit
MPKGGYRPGSGRKRDVNKKETPKQAEARKIREIIAAGQDVKENIFKEYLSRVDKGEQLSSAEKLLMDRLSNDLAENSEKEVQNFDPLAYMLRVMNDPAETTERRDRMAVSAAPYIHPRASELGKKEETEKRAKNVLKGRFASGRPPLALVAK